MPRLDPEQTRAAAQRLQTESGTVGGQRSNAAPAALAQPLRDSVTRWVLDDIQTLVQTRLTDVSGELTALATGMRTLADNADTALNGER